MYSLNKCRSILKQTNKNFRRKEGKLTPEVHEKIKSNLMELQESLLNRDRTRADYYAKILETDSKKHLKRSLFTFLLDSSLALTIALGVAIIIRQTAFENFEIPTGSMRPTFREQDKLIVSKTQFGINIPLTASHLLFNSKAIQRMGVVIFTGENMDIPNVKTNYFYIFPGYKQYIKRMIGLPGDTLYFYGGKIYGIDKDGHDITTELQKASLKDLEHIPFIYLEGKAKAFNANNNQVYSQVVLEQMNMPVAKLHLSANRDVHYDLLEPKEKKDDTFDIYKLWGMDNFATARIIPRHILEKKHPLPRENPKVDFYLELTHHPSVKKSTLKRDAFFRTRPMASTEISYIPLDDLHMRRIWDHIYTGRFIVENGYFHRYGLSRDEAKQSRYLPHIKGNIPDGMYEFTKGILREVKTQGILSTTSKDHPLATYDPMKCFTFFNAGIECDIRFLPYDQNWVLHPARYAYFRDGDLYLMGASIFDKNDPVLVSYNEKEKAAASLQIGYTPFIDQGPPLLADGTLNTALIQAYGIKVPEKHYLVLGDNHAMSGDSREFGFVPEENLRGIPSFVYWAPGGRFGFPSLNVYELITPPRIITWSVIIVACIAYSRYSRRRISLDSNR